MAVIAKTTDTTTTTKTAGKIDIPVGKRQLGRRVLRGIARVTAVTLALLVGLAAVGATYEALAAGGDAKAYPAPGRLVDVGGYSLHIQCAGTGSPTVILDAGLGGTSLDWNLVQSEIGAMTQVCSYDRAGMGWSDAGPSPRTPDQIARELHTLLTNAGIAGPYILVGHSLAGKNVRLFASQHPNEVAGMVLVDARSEYVDAHTSAGDASGFQQIMGAQEHLLGVLRGVGVIRLMGANISGAPSMASNIRTEMALLNASQRSTETTIAEARERAASDALLQAAASLGDRPLIVLASEQNMTQDPTWPEAQRLQAALSTNGHLTTVAGSGHYIHWEQPSVVINAVKQVVAQARGH